MKKILIRLSRSFKYKFAEWIASWSMFWWGIIVLFDTDLFKVNPFFMSLETMMPQLLWGILAVVFGTIRLVFLTINGAWRPSAHIRVLGGIFGTTLWGSMILAGLQLSFVTPNIVFYCGYLLSDVYSIWFAAEDAKFADLAYKKR